MDTEEDFRLLIARVQAGSEAAAEVFFREYGPSLMRAVRRKLDSRLRQKFDSADFVQAVWASFFAECAGQKNFENPKHLVAFLVTMARNKVGMEFRRYLQGKKHCVDREISLDEVAATAAIRDTEPSPSQHAMAHEYLERLTASQPEHHRQVIEMRFHGYTYSEIGAKLELDERTVRRVIEKLSREQS